MHHDERFTAATGSERWCALLLELLTSAVIHDGMRSSVGGSNSRPSPSRALARPAKIRLSTLLGTKTAGGLLGMAASAHIAAVG